MVDPTGEFGVPEAIYGAIVGATGGFVASGGSFREKLVGVAAGALAGGAVGFIAPQSAGFVGMAAAGALASAGGQAAGSVTNAAIDKGISNVTPSDVKVDAVTTAAGALGAGVGGLVGKSVVNHITIQERTQLYEKIQDIMRITLLCSIWLRLGGSVLKIEKL